MNKAWICLAAGLAAAAPARAATTTINYVFSGAYGLTVSADGRVIAGNNVSDYGPFRWTQATGVVALPLSAAPIIGRTGGQPGISDDGTKVASSIASFDSTFVTAGLWTLGSGWQQLMPPAPPTAGITDEELASVWGSSGDGNTVVGLFWRQGFGRAHGFRWTPATGAVDLGSSGNASRANDANYNGTVIAGWDEHPVQGFRRACAWVNGQLSVLGDPSLPGEAHAVNAYGDIVVGIQNNPATTMREAAMWKRNGGTWSATQYLGAVPGTSGDYYGINLAKGVSADGNIVVGYTSYGGDPFYTTGFVWTPATGIVDVNEFLANHGILPDPAFTIASLNCLTPDGRKLVGFGKDVLAPFATRTFIIDLDAGATDVAGNAAGEAAVRMVATPNPVRTATTLQFDLPARGHAALEIYDSAGRVVRQLLAETMTPGAHRVVWDRRDATGARVPGGVYYSRLTSGGVQATGKVVVLQ